MGRSSSGGATARVDRIVTRDGRVIEVRSVRPLPDGGGYRLVFEHGVIDCPAHFVASVGRDGNGPTTAAAGGTFADGWELETRHFRLKTNTSREVSHQA